MPLRSAGVTETSSGWLTSPLTMYSRKVCISPLRPESGCGGRCLHRFFDEARHRLRRLGAFAEPILRPVHIQREVVFLLQRQISAQLFQTFPIARAAVVRNDNAEGRFILRPDALQTYSDCHKFSCMLHGENPALRAPRSFPFLSKKEMGAYSPNPALASAHFRIFREKSAVIERSMARFT